MAEVRVKAKLVAIKRKELGPLDSFLSKLVKQDFSMRMVHFAGEEEAV